MGGPQNTRILFGRMRSLEDVAGDRGRERWGAVRKAQAFQNFPRGIGRMNGCENPEASLAVRAF